MNNFFLIFKTFEYKEWASNAEKEIKVELSNFNRKFLVIIGKSNTEKLLTFRYKCIAAPNYPFESCISVIIYDPSSKKEIQQITNNYTFELENAEVTEVTNILFDQLQEGSLLKDDHIQFNFKISNAVKKINIIPSPAQNIPYIGLTNQGHTCFINCILQILYHLPMFNNIVFSIPHEACGEIIIALQRLFYKMSSEKRAVTTRDLTQTFSLPHDYFYSEHDCHEFFTILFDQIKDSLKNSPSEIERFQQFFELTLFKKIFPTNQELVEKACDLSLPVTLGNLTSALDDYFAPEKVGQTQQVITKSISKCPPVLVIHLNRFEYNVRSGRTIKLNNYFQFSSILDLKKYVEANFNGTTEYKLVSFASHKGYANSGHYITFVKPLGQKAWFKFDDSKVTIETQKPLLNNFGTNTKQSTHQIERSQSTVVPNNNMIQTFMAYLLVYVRRDIYDNSKPFSLKEIAPDVIDRITKHRCPNSNILANLKTEHSLSVSIDTRKRHFYQATSTVNIPVAITKTNESLYRAFANYRACDPNRIRLWHCLPNGQPDFVIPIDSQFTLEENHQSIYCESKPVDEPLILSADQLVVFVSYFDYDNFSKQMRYLFRIIVNSNSPVSMLSQKIYELMHLSNDLQLLCYIDDDIDRLPRKLHPALSFKSNNVKQCSPLFFQLQKDINQYHPVEKKKCAYVLADIWSQYAPITLDLYFKIRFKSVSTHILTFSQYASTEAFKLKVPLDFSIRDYRNLVCDALMIGDQNYGNKIDKENDKLCLFRATQNENSMQSSIVDLDYATINDIPRDNEEEELYFFFYNFKGQKNGFENKVVVRILYTWASNKRLIHHAMPIGSKFQDIINELKDRVISTSKKLEIRNYTDHKEIGLDEILTEKNGIVVINSVEEDRGL